MGALDAPEYPRLWLVSCARLSEDPICFPVPTRRTFNIGGWERARDLLQHGHLAIARFVFDHLRPLLACRIVLRPALPAGQLVVLRIKQASALGAEHVLEPRESCGPRRTSRPGSRVWRTIQRINRFACDISPANHFIWCPSALTVELNVSSGCACAQRRPP